MCKKAFYSFYKGLCVLDAYFFGLRKKLQVNRPIYLDIGGRGGLRKRWHLIEKFGLLEAIIIEPDPAEIKKLEQQYPHARIIECGLADKSTEATLNICKDSARSSILKPNSESLNQIGFGDEYIIENTINVSLKSFQNIADDLKIASPNFVKIDVQGFEYQVLQGFGDKLKDVLCLELEVQFLEFYQEQKKFSELFEYLFERGFSLVALRPIGLFSEFAVLECNAYFISRRELTALEQDKVTFWKKALSIPSREDYQEMP
jgi:FkbM family methyltransferase